MTPTQQSRDRRRNLLRRVLLRGIKGLPPPKDDAALRAALALRDLVAGRRPLLEPPPATAADVPKPRREHRIRPAPPPERPELPERPERPGPVAPEATSGSLVPAPRPGESVVRPPTGLDPVPALPALTDWRLPEGITGTGSRVRSLYRTGSGAQIYDAELLDKLNAEYAGSPLVPAPPSYTAQALAASAQRRVRWVHDMVGLTGRRTLEIGCGNGFEVWSLAHNLGCDAHGVDAAHYEPWDQLAGPGVHFECADLSAEHPYEPDSFDRVLSFTVWEHVTHPFGMLQAAYDVLKPGGIAWIRANLYAGPQASHRYRDIHFPWPHLLFTDQVVRDWDVANDREPIGLAWVNRLSWLHYEYYADRLGFEIVHRSFTQTPIDEAFYLRFEDMLGRYPRADLARDYLLLVLRKPL